MSQGYENTIKEQFSQLIHDNFHVQLSVKTLFVCGGEVDPLSTFPKSYRDNLLHYTASKNIEFHDCIVRAEEFKDYYKDDNYSDLLTFEDDIAYLSTLVIIFLESPGSLVELGLYCSRPQFYKKLLIVAPEEEVAGEDSFIYLGPLEYIKKKSSDSVLVYPFPKNEEEYDELSSEDLCNEIQAKIDKANDTEKFDLSNSGHLSLMITEIIRLCFPIQIGEIEICFESLGVGVRQGQVRRLLYLLQKMKFVAKKNYGRNTYYYPCLPEQKLVSFGKTKRGKTLDSQTLFMAVRQSFVAMEDAHSNKRKGALRQINELMQGEGE